MFRIGIDITSIDRFEHLIARFGTRGLKRFLTAHELSLYVHDSTKIASAWACKEALSKALGTGIGKECSFLDIEVLRDHRGCPFFIIAQKVVEHFSIIQHSISLSHEKNMVIAAVIVLFSQ